MSVYQMLSEELPARHYKIKGHGYVDLLAFDFKTHSIRNGSFYLMKDGKLMTDCVVLQNGTEINLPKEIFSTQEVEEPWQKIEDLYYQYYVSRPTEVANFLRPNYRAKTADELTFDELVDGKPRQQALYAFEGYMMLGIVSGILQWLDAGKWFWQSSKYPGLIIYRDWFRKE